LDGFAGNGFDAAIFQPDVALWNDLMGLVYGAVA
jgi:hypothetical protein